MEVPVEQPALREPGDQGRAAVVDDGEPLAGELPRRLRPQSEQLGAGRRHVGWKVRQGRGGGKDDVCAAERVGDQGAIAAVEQRGDLAGECCPDRVIGEGLMRGAEQAERHRPKRVELVQAQPAGVRFLEVPHTVTSLFPVGRATSPARKYRRFTDTYAVGRYALSAPEARAACAPWARFWRPVTVGIRFPSHEARGT